MCSSDLEEEEAAIVLGATGWQTFRRVTLPKIKWGLLYGVVLCTAREANDGLHRALTARRGEWVDKGLERVSRAGDCLAPRYLADAIFDGHRIAREFESVDPERPKAIIRERQVWGHAVFPRLGDRVL